MSISKATRNITAVFVGLALTLALSSVFKVAPAAAADSVQQFYGTWVPVDQPATCAEVEEWGEGPQIIIGEDHFEDGVSPACEDVGLHIFEGRLRVSASCESAEVGYRPITAEFSLKNPDTLIAKGLEYNRCTP